MNIKNKKEKMQVVSFCFLFFIGVLGGCTTMTSLQDTFSGTFHQKYNPVGIGVTYHFNDGIFVKITYEHLNSQTKYKGSYYVSGDTLVLNYRSFNDNDNSYFTFLKKEPIHKDSVYFTTQIQVLNNQREPYKGVNLVILNKEEQVMKGFVSDSMGSFPTIVVDDKVKGKIRFAAVGAKNLILDVDTLVGYQSELQVILTNKDTTYSNFAGKRRYLLQKVRKNKIILKSLENDEKLILEKTQTDKKIN